MSLLRTVYHLARADFLERTRRYSFLAALGAVLFLGYAVHNGDLMLRLERYRGVFNSAWTGAMMTLVVTSFLSLAGFYLVKNTIERDRTTGVGQILAGTPLRRPVYTLGKTLSNFVFLSLLIAIPAGGAVLLQLTRSEDAPLRLGTLLAPLAWVALPSMLLVSALAVLFEAVRWLRAGTGNVVYFFLWTFALYLGMRSAVFDHAGFRLIGDSMRAAALEAYPHYRGGIDLTFAGLARPEAGTFVWNGIEWNAEVVAGRLGFVVLAVALALLAAVPFDRFDSSHESLRLGRKVAGLDADGGERDGVAPPAPTGRAGRPSAERQPSVVTLTRAKPGSGFTAMYVAELRLMAHSVPRLWHAVALGLLVACLFAPLPVVHRRLLPIAWIWPLLLWSAMGTREGRYHTGPLVFSSAGSLSRQFPALWLAGVTLSVATGSAAAFRLLLDGHMPGLTAWCAGALFIPSLALFLGTWSGSGKLFEACYVAVWYVGPVRQVPAMDFIGTTRSAESTETTFGYLAAALVLLALAVMRRRHQTQRAIGL